MQQANNIPYSQQPTIIQVGTSGKLIPYVIGGVLLVGAAVYAEKAWQKYRIAKENSKAAQDPNVNLAAQIYSENRAWYTEDSVMIDLFRQVKDYKAVKESYKVYGKDLLSDTRSHVSSGAYQQLLNILGNKAGGVKAGSGTSQQAVQVSSKPQWLVTKVDARLRKTPKAGSAVLTLRSNIIETISTNMTVGFIDTLALRNNGGKLFYDDENNTFFIPVRVFDSKDIKKTYPVYIASSNVTIVADTIPKDKDLVRISAMQYNAAYAVSGLSGTIKSKKCFC